MSAIVPDDPSDSGPSVRGHHRDWRWDETLFEGTAPYYERVRVPYAPGLADAMADALDLDGTGRLLDVGCGPGIVTLLVAHLFAEVVGVDPDPGMIDEAARRANTLNVTNASWVKLRAEELPDDLGTFRAITFAASFHWMDREKVAATVIRMLDPRGVVIHVDNMGYRSDAPIDNSDLPHPPLPDDVVAEVRVRYLGPDRRAGRGIRNTSPDDEDDIFRDAGFTGRVVSVPDGRAIDRSIDDIVAYAFSASSTAPHLFGDRKDDFERDLRAALLDASPSGLFSIRLPGNDLRIWTPKGDVAS